MKWELSSAWLWIESRFHPPTTRRHTLISWEVMAHSKSMTMPSRRDSSMSTIWRRLTPLLMKDSKRSASALRNQESLSVSSSAGRSIRRMLQQFIKWSCARETTSRIMLSWPSKFNWTRRRENSSEKWTSSTSSLTLVLKRPRRWSKGKLPELPSKRLMLDSISSIRWCLRPT